MLSPAHLRCAVKHSGSLLSRRHHKPHSVTLHLAFVYGPLEEPFMTKHGALFFCSTIYFPRPHFPFLLYFALPIIFPCSGISYVSFNKKFHLPWRLTNYICDFYLSCHLNVDSLTLKNLIKQVPKIIILTQISLNCIKATPYLRSEKNE